MSQKSKTKGSNFERKIAKLFTAWWHMGGLEGTFDRVPASGGLHRRIERSDYIGDITCSPDHFTATIECKCSEAWEYSELFQETFAKKPKTIQTGKGVGKPCSPGSIGEYWYQACEEGNRAAKIPLLVFTKNYHKNLIIIPTDLPALDLEQVSTAGVRKQFKVEESLPHIEHTMILPLDAFFSLNPRYFYSA